MTVSMITAGLLGLILIALSLRISLIRRASHVSLGDGNNPILAARIRAQANFTEYVPTGLILLFIAEQTAGAHWLVITIAAALVLGRILHAIGMGLPAPNGPRILGIVLTWASILLLALICLVHGIERLLP